MLGLNEFVDWLWLCFVEFAFGVVSGERAIQVFCMRLVDVFFRLRSVSSRICSCKESVGSIPSGMFLFDKAE